MIGVPFAWFVGDVVAFVESFSGTSMLAGTYFSTVPSEVRVLDVIAIAILVLAISMAATLYPASKAAALRPVAVLRDD